MSPTSILSAGDPIGIRVNRARNGIAHDDQQALRQLAREGYAINLTTFRRWRGALSGLANTLDLVIADHLAATFGRKKPW